MSSYSPHLSNQLEKPHQPQRQSPSGQTSGHPNPMRLTPADVQALQPVLGNHTLQRLVAGRGEDAHEKMARPLLIQPKLIVGAAKDRYEEEADRVAEQVTRAQQPGTRAKEAPARTDKNQGRGAPGASIQRRPSSDTGVIQRFTVTDPSQGEASVDTTGNELVKNKKKRELFYERTQRKGVGLRVSDDGRMAVPDTYQTKDFYADMDIIKHTRDVMEAQDSFVDFILTSASIRSPVNGETLYGIEPVGRTSHTVVKEMDGASSFIDACIEMAHRVTRGTASSKGGTAILQDWRENRELEREKGKGKLGKEDTVKKIVREMGEEGEDEKVKEKVNEDDRGKDEIEAKKHNTKEISNFKSPTERGDEFRKDFPASQAMELGINEFASPEVGDMLTTLNLLHRPNYQDFEYHFAGVVAKSGSDYVTLENYNREGESTPDLEAFFKELMLVEKYKNQYVEIVERLRKEYLSTIDKTATEKERLETMENYAPRIAASAERLFWEAVEKAEDMEAIVKTNVRDPVIKNALWYFQMYGPPDKSVVVDKITKDGEGGSTTSKAKIDQSFHGHMGALDEFGETLTLRLEGNTSDVKLPPEETSGINEQLLNITEPPVKSSGLFSSIYNSLPSWSSTTIESNKLKETVYGLAKSGEVTGSDLTKHEKQLSTLGTGQSQHESGYVLKILRLEIALTAKSREIKQRAEAFELLNPKRMKELAKVSPRQQRAIPKLRDSQVVRNFERDYLTYRQIVNNLLTHTEYKNAFPGEHAEKLKEAIGEMAKQLINLDNQVSLVQVALYD